MTRRSDPAHFWSRIDRSGGESACWPFTGPPDANGYGRLRYQGRAVLAHRLALALSRGPVPADALVIHGCDNPPCCNPAHLRLGTHADNAADRRDRRRHWRDRNPEAALRGERNGAARLTEATVRAIRAAWAEGGRTRAQLAQQFNVRPGTLSHVLSRTSWRHVDEKEPEASEP